MTERHVLDRPAEIYRPFTHKETARLRAFVSDVRRLGAMRFFEQVPKEASLTFDETGFGQHMQEPDDEAVRAVITQFRQVYNPQEPTSYKPTIALLKRSVHEYNGPLRDEAMEALEAHLKTERFRAREGIGIGFVFDNDSEQTSIDVRKLMDAYFHGHYLHSGNEKSDLVARLDGMGPFPRMTLYSTMLALRNVYWVAANVVDRILQTPALLDVEEPVDS